MQAIRTLLQAIVAIALAATLFVTVPPAHAAGGTITVTGTADDLVVGNLDGNGTCDLREAVELVNTNAAPVGDCTGGSTTPGDIDTIAFNIGAGGAQTITLASALLITQPVIIDGSTQPGYSSGPLIKITGGPDTYTLLYFSVTAPNSTVKGLNLTSGAAASTAVTSLQLESSGNTVVGNYFNTNGTASTGSHTTGIGIDSPGNTIGGPNGADRNQFGGLIGVYISGASGNTVQNNSFGVTSSGSALLSGLPGTSLIVDGAGVLIDGGYSESATNIVRDNIMAGSSFGIKLGRGDDEGLVYGTSILGNKIGLGEDGVTLLANGIGIALYGAYDSAIGGTTPEDRNVVSGNLYGQIQINAAIAHADNNIIQGNYIGTRENGLQALVSSPTSNMNGIAVLSGTGNVIGGTATGSGNVISGNYNGVVIGDATGTIVRGNKIGTDALGTSGIPNFIGISADSDSNIGDTTTPGNNLIAANSNAAIAINSGAAVTVVGNRIGVDALGNALGNDFAIGLQNGASVQLVRNWIGNSTTDAIHIYAGTTVTGDATDNCFTGNSTYAVYNDNSTAVSFAKNWWGDASGPGGQGPGTGDAVSDFVTFDPFYIAPAAACGPGVHADPSPLAFGKQLAGTTSSAKTLTLSNNGIQPLSLTALSAEAPYSITGGSCPAALPQTLQPGESCTVDVNFTPLVTGVMPPHNLTVTSDAASSPDLIPLTGTGASGTILLKNGSFELDANNDLKPDNFTYANFNTQTDKRDCTVRRAGTCSLKLRGNGLQKTVTQAVSKAGVAGDDFRFVLWSKAAYVPTDAVYRLRVSFYNGTTLLANYNLNFNRGTHGFQQVSGGFTAPGPYTRVVFKIVYKAGSGNVWFDAGLLNWAH